MKHPTKNYLLMILAFALVGMTVLSSCKKDKDDDDSDHE